MVRLRLNMASPLISRLERAAGSFSIQVIDTSF